MKFRRSIEILGDKFLRKKIIAIEYIVPPPSEVKLGERPSVLFFMHKEDVTQVSSLLSPLLTKSKKFYILASDDDTNSTEIKFRVAHLIRTATEPVSGIVSYYLDLSKGKSLSSPTTSFRETEDFIQKATKE